jgi:phage-related holin
MKFLAGGSLLFIKLTVFPAADLLMWMGIAILLDFITGVLKAVVLKQARTSSGYRRTITKFLQYGGALAVGLIISNGAKENNLTSVLPIVKFFNDALVVFILYIELTSVLENISAVDDKSLFSKYFIQPMLKLLTFQIKRNPLVRESEAVKLPE